jgi:photosystem II stability/assembly factor-like uncharacterized protein
LNRIYFSHISLSFFIKKCTFDFLNNKMKNRILVFCFFLLLISCKSDGNFIGTQKFSKFSIDTLLYQNLSCRAILIDKNKVWYAANNGLFGSLSLNSSKQFQGNVAKDSVKIEFRSIAQTDKSIFVLAVGNPALLYKIKKDGSQIKLVYTETNEKVFYDCMQFLNNKIGFAIGDPILDKPSILKTIDGGESWTKIPSEKLPKLETGEAFFAASNTNLIIKNKILFLVTGGQKSRLLKSIDLGLNWTVYDTPIIQGGTMTGAFTADFFDENSGYISGGNYDELTNNSKNKAVTNDGGKTWKLVNQNQAFGYASCVQYFPESKGKAIISVGATGVYYQPDPESDWVKLSNDKDFYTIRFINSKTAIAAGKNKIVRLKFE